MATNAITPPSAGATLPTAPSTSDPANFDARADAFFAALPGLQTSENALKDNVYANTVISYNNAVQTASDSAAAASSAATAATSAGATLWVSGTTYAIGDRRYSPANGLTYRRLTAGAGTTDPSADTTNWTPIGLNAPAQIVTTSAVTAISGQCLALSNSTAQGSATNLMLYSEQLNNGVWGTWQCSVTSNAIMAPDGTMTGDKIVENTSTNSHNTNQSLSVTSGTTYTFSVFVKAGERTKAAVNLNENYGAFPATSILVDLFAGTVSVLTGSPISYGIIHIGNGWYRVWVSQTASATVLGVPSVGTYTTSGVYTGDGTSGIYAWGGQLEANSTVSSYIQTTSATVTRSAGVVAPQRIVLPANPGADAWVKPVVANGVATNVIDPNGEQFKGANGIVSGPIELDNIGFSGALQFIDGYWRFV